jgi:fungalysin metallopeptidase (M36)/proprotein convertase P-domain-containing protein/fungalysin/thermolysin propeptide
MKRTWTTKFAALIALSAACSLAGCETDTGDGGDVGAVDSVQQKEAMLGIESRTGGPVDVERDDAGRIRVVAMTAGKPYAGLVGASADAVARGFLAENRALFGLSEAAASEFAVGRVDDDAKHGLRHVTLQRTVGGVPVFQGAMTVHMDANNGVFRVLCDENYRLGEPVNARVLGGADAAMAAARAAGVRLSPRVEQQGDRTILTDAALLDQSVSELRVVNVGPGDVRYAYQVTLSWLGQDRVQNYDLFLVDAQDGAVIARHSLVNDAFRGRVFTGTPGANPTADTRVLVSFDGDPASSPSGWVDTTRKTRGNNAIAATDLNANNSVGTNEIQPTANAAGDFDFPFSPTTNSTSFREASVTNAFFFVNDWHDRTYALGFTEAAGNFQTNNFGKGGAGNDEIQVDAQDGSGTNNANMATPPDGSRPRMQMFIFNFTGGVIEDGDFDGTVVHHEATHGLSNRLVGGGSTLCLNGTQSGGMGEGWGDFLGGSFINTAVVGAYVTGDAAKGIRRAPMDTSPFTYADIKSGAMAEVHDAGEIWAATLFDLREKFGAAVVERLVVQGMKLTPCNPTMLQARDAIISADQALNGGANRCEIFKTFAGRQMGSGASSANHNTTSGIVLSTAIPTDCGGTPPPTGTTFASVDVPKSIPDNNSTGVTSVLNVPAGHGALTKLTVSANISHTFRGDLVISLISPDNKTLVLSNRAGGSADNFVTVDQDVLSSFSGSVGSGQWKLKVQDLASIDTGSINSWSLNLAP